MRSTTRERENTVAPQSDIKSKELKFWSCVNKCTTALALLSFVLSLIAFVQVTQLRSDTAAADIKSSSATGIQTLVDRLKSDIDQLRAKVKAADKERKRMETKLNDLTQKFSTLQNKADQEVWKKGCPQSGISNGDICFVRGRSKANYSEAVESCSEQGGLLALIRDSEVLKAVTSSFPTQPYLVNAHFDVASGSWKTTLEDDADFLPWPLTVRGTGGDCVYAFRSGFKQWHCHAQLEFLCSFL